MKRRFALALVVLVLLAFAWTVYADKPTKPPEGPDDPGMPFGNGFPSGPHFNLNLIAKQSHFTCPCPEYVDGQRQLGNVVFIPREQGDDPITILMESGRKGPKHHPDISSLQVTNWCSESFEDCDPETDYDGAVVELPKHEAGYAVYARLGGKPGKVEGPTVVISPSLAYVEDESGHDLILLGLVTDKGGFKWDGVELVRTDSNPATKGRGTLKATWITPLFLWSGEVCYVNDLDLYCPDSSCIAGPTLCCIEGVDGYEGCVEQPVGGCGELGEGYVPVTSQCHDYEDTWVFNIADFVGYLWHLTSDGAYVIQVRFYPL